MKTILVALVILASINLYSQDLNWNTSAIPNNSLSFNFGSIGTPASAVTYAVTGPGTITTGPIRFTTAQGDGAWRTAITFAAVNDLKVYTFTFNSAVCGLSFILYDIDGNNALGGDRAIVTANNSGSPQNITMAALDASPPTITGSGTATATATGTQGNQTDDRVQVTITGCVSTLTIQYGNNPAGPTGGRSFSIGNLSWSTNTLPVTFTQVSGQKIADGVIALKWKSENEVNVSKYEIERSTDGNNFISAGFVTTLSSDGNYSFTDNTLTRGILFYRIKEIDIDTRFQYSSVIALRFATGAKQGITVFPSPASQYIYVTMNDNSLLDKLIIFTNAGKIMFQKNGPENKIDIQHLPAGLYRIKATNKTGEVFVSSFIRR
jgi:hypothetical protein